MASRRWLLVGSAAAAAVLLLSGCSSTLHKVFPNQLGDASSAAPVPVVRSVRVGAVHLAVVGEFATPATRAHGLMRTQLPAASVAVFYWGGKQVSESFWMQDTPEPLSLLWVAGSRVVGHVEMTQCRLSCPTYAPPAPYDLALEAPAGTFASTAVGTPVVLS